jgi:hypothetical protein
MTAQRRDRNSARRWIRKVLPLSIGAMVVGFLGTYLCQAVQKARNAAWSANTT